MKNSSSKEYILEAYVRLLSQKNDSTISITEICNCAGVSRTSFYRFFETKEEVLYELKKQSFKHLEKDIKKIFNSENTYEECLKSVTYFVNEKDRLMVYYKGLLNGAANLFLTGSYQELENYSYSDTIIVSIFFTTISNFLRRGLTDSPEYVATILNEAIKTHKEKIELHGEKSPFCD